MSTRLSFRVGIFLKVEAFIPTIYLDKSPSTGGTLEHYFIFI